MNLFIKRNMEKNYVFNAVWLFFEVYSCKGGMFLNNTIEDFSRICDMRIANKKCKHKGLSVYMCGFPEVQLEKYIHKLNEAGYTVAVWVQEQPIQN